MREQLSSQQVKHSQQRQELEQELCDLLGRLSSTSESKEAVVSALQQNQSDLLTSLRNAEELLRERDAELTARELELGTASFALGAASTGLLAEQEVCLQLRQRAHGDSDLISSLEAVLLFPSTKVMRIIPLN